MTASCVVESRWNNCNCGMNRYASLYYIIRSPKKDLILERVLLRREQSIIMVPTALSRRTSLSKARDGSTSKVMLTAIQSDIFLNSDGAVIERLERPVNRGISQQ